MEELLSKIIKKAYELKFLEKKSQINVANCLDDMDEFNSLMDLVRNKYIPSNDIITFKIVTRYICLIELNTLKQSLLKQFYEDKISLNDLLIPQNKNGGINMSFHNEFHSHDNSTQNISLNYNLKGDFQKLENELMSIGIPSKNIEELKTAIIEDENFSKNIDDSLLSKTKIAAKQMISFVASNATRTSVIVATQTLINALSSYYGFPVQF